MNVGLALGSTLVPSVRFGVPPKRTSQRLPLSERVRIRNRLESSRRRDGFANARDARATRMHDPRSL